MNEENKEINVNQQSQVVEIPNEQTTPNVEQIPTQEVMEPQVVASEPMKSTEQVVSVTEEQPNLGEQKTELVTDPITLKTETRVVEETPVEEVKVEEKKPIEDGPKWKRVLVFIFFILVFSFIMGMPYINEYLDKFKKNTIGSDIERRAKEIEKEQEKEKKAKETPVVEEEYKTLTCLSQPQQTTDYNKVVEEKFEYNSNNQIITSSLKTTYTFTIANESYNTLKTQCDENGLKYIDKEGYESACSYSETEVIIENTFDLATFKTIRDGANTIEANAKYHDKLDGIKAKLVSQGYTCE